MTIRDDTPRGLYLVGDTYYVNVKVGSKRVRKSTRTKKLETALRVLADVSGQEFANIATTRLLSHKQWIITTLNSIQKRNRKYGYSPMPREHLEYIIKRSQGRCEVTGIPFDWGSTMREPYGPSLDRKNPKDGYNVANRRLVCLSVNMAMSDWGEDVLITIGQAMIAKRTTDDALARVAEWAKKHGREYQKVETDG